MYKVIFKNKIDESRQAFKFFMSEEKAKLYQKELTEQGYAFVKIEDMNDKTNNVEN
jgi:hypothetical protein